MAESLRISDLVRCIWQAARAALVVTASVSASAAAQSDLTFTFLCVPEGATGFDLEGGQWKQKTFTTEPLVVTRLPAPSESWCPRVGPAPTDFKSYYEGGDGHAKGLGCYKVGHPGEDGLEQQCDEYWVKPVGGDASIDSIRCGLAYDAKIDLRALRFVRTGTLSFAATGSEAADSLFIEVGGCSRIQ